MEKIGKYKIVDELGKGGMGVVYKAYDPVMDREVAIKVILEMALEVPEIKARFYREARTAGNLSHENITIIHDVGEDEGKPFIVMEYLPGNDLRELLETNYPLTLLQKLEIAFNVTQGLAFSHSRDIIHRDIKPANIRITDDGKVKIMDFGIARPGSSSLTSTGTLIGTPYYMSPEQIQGRKVDKRSDIFSFGVLLYELLTYKKPFTGNEPTAVMYKIVHEEPENAADLEQVCPQTLRDIVSRILEKDPARRYQNFEDIGRDLEFIMNDLRQEGRRKLDAHRKQLEKLLLEARNMIGKRRYREAYNLTDQAASLDAGSSQVLRVRDEIKHAEDEEKKKAFTSERFNAARKLYTSKRYVQAIDALKELLAAEPQHADASQLLRTAQDALANHLFSEAEHFFSKRDLETAERIARDVLTHRPDHQQARGLLKAIEADRLGQATQLAEPALERTLVVPPEPEAAPVRPPRSARSSKSLILVGMATLLALAAAYYFIFVFSPGAPEGSVALNILPWAEVVKIENEGGRTLPLAEDTFTPCRLSLPEGTYAIHVTNPDLGETVVLTVTVKEGQLEEVREKLPGYDYYSILSTF
ncbi:MAG: protein kinase [Bacteroidota bacterium]